jgi:hypothetical protein
MLALLLVACALSVTCGARSDSERARGLIIAVESASVARADAVTLRTDDGRVLELRVDPAVAVSPGHLREHMALGEPVVVEYARRGDALVATRIDDG